MVVLKEIIDPRTLRCSFCSRINDKSTYQVLMVSSMANICCECVYEINEQIKQVRDALVEHADVEDDDD